MFSEIIKQVQEDGRLVPDLLKAENGNNFRAVSESAILDVINPILIKNGWFYEIRVRKSDLQIREAYGSKGKKLQFIATVEISVVFHNDADPQLVVGTESVGMGIDDNDKAMGKAYTYAVKYALLKLFRLRFGDDPDFEASKPLHVEKPKEEKIKPENEVKKPKTAEKPQKSGRSSGMDKPMTEAQRDYILGMMKQHNVNEKEILEKFGVEPSRDEFIPMPTARAIIKWLEEGGYLPF
ncbi:MAG: ERF family protein [Methanobrevibacter sp.]|nr:ERF family protein [Methanobrevibacter sp.]